MSDFELLRDLPDTAVIDVKCIDHGRLKDGRCALRVTFDRLLTENELNVMRLNPVLVGAGSICHYRYASEIQYSYIYILTEPTERRQAIRAAR